MIKFTAAGVGGRAESKFLYVVLSRYTNKKGTDKVSVTITCGEYKGKQTCSDPPEKQQVSKTTSDPLPVYTCIWKSQRQEKDNLLQ